MDSLVVRRMLLEDLDSVVEIEPLAFGSHHWTRQNFTIELDNPNAYYYLAELDEGAQKKIVGYVGSWIVLDEMHITTLAVHPDYRRRHIAEKILVGTIKLALANRVHGITLEVRKSNIAAQKLYEKYGFQQQGLRKKYYNDNKEDAVLLWTEDIQAEKFKAKLLENIKALEA